MKHASCIHLLCSLTFVCFRMKLTKDLTVLVLILVLIGVNAGKSSFFHFSGGCKMLRSISPWCRL